MSAYIPYNAQVREYNMQQRRKQYGLKTGEYIKYPSADAKEHFVLKASKLYAADGQLHADGVKLKEQMDHYLAMGELENAEHVAAQTSEPKNES